MDWRGFVPRAFLSSMRDAGWRRHGSHPWRRIRAAGLWVGTADAGLLFWDGTRLNPAAESGPLKRVTQVQSLAVDGAGALWVGTWGAGLWQGQGGRFRQFTTADGLGDGRRHGCGRGS